MGVHKLDQTDAVIMFAPIYDDTRNVRRKMFGHFWYR